MSSVGLDLVARRVVEEVRRAVEVLAGGRPREVQRERQVLLEDGLDLGLVVGEDERVGARAGRLGGVELRREADRAELEVGPVDGLAVRDVEVGRLVGLVGVDGGVAVGAGQRARERVVVGRAVGDEAERAVEQLRGRVVVEVRDRLDAAQQPVIGEVLGLGVRVRAAVVGVGGVRARALLVERPLLGEVAVRVDAVGRVAVDPVVVVVAQRLAPQAVGARLARAADLDGGALAARERVVVAVRVLDGQEPQLGLGQDLAGRAGRPGCRGSSAPRGGRPRA